MLGHMSMLVISVGVPGSGKTTFLKRLARERGYSYVATDDIREELAGDAADQSRNADVWKEAHARVAKALAAGEDVAFDATFANARERRAFIAFAREMGAGRIEALWFDVPLESAKERNRGRERAVPEHVLERMHAFIRKDPPTEAEGLDMVTRFAD